MIVTKNYCDRCHNHGHEVEIPVNFLYRAAIEYRNETNSEPYVLCARCAEKLENFLAPDGDKRITTVS